MPLAQALFYMLLLLREHPRILSLPLAAYGRISLRVGVVAAILAVVLAILILVLIYYVKMLKTTRVICRVLRTGKVRENISMYHIVFNFLAMLVNVPILMMNLRNAPYLASAVPSVIQSILTLISYIAVTVSLIMLRSRLQALMSENPMYR